MKLSNGTPFSLPLALPLALLAAPVLGLVACTGIRSAPEGSPRTEIEVFVDVADDFLSPLAEEVERGDVERIADDAVLAVADMGLRFYPVLSEHYASDHTHPDYTMRVELMDLEVLLDHDLIEEEDEDPYIETSVKEVVCVAVATIERRRPGGPALVVGRSRADAEVRASDIEGPMAVFALRRKAEDGSTLYVTRQDVVDAVERAVERALVRLQKPIDREFAPVEDGETVSSRSSG